MMVSSFASVALILNGVASSPTITYNRSKVNAACTPKDLKHTETKSLQKNSRMQVNVNILKSFFTLILNEMVVSGWYVSLRRSFSMLGCQLAETHEKKTRQQETKKAETDTTFSEVKHIDKTIWWQVLSVQELRNQIYMSHIKAPKSQQIAVTDMREETF